MNEQNGRPGRVTIRDVARLANTSVSTVSAALSGNAGVAPETKERVIWAANQLGWRPDRRASQLRRGRSPLVGVIYEVEQSFQSSVVDSIYASAKDHKFEVFLAGATAHHSELDCLRLLLGERCAAIVVMGPGLSETQIGEASSYVPTLSLCRSVDVAGVNMVSSDVHQAMSLTIKHLYDLGHRNIVHINGSDRPMGDSRDAMYRQIMTEMGLEQYVQVIEGGDTVNDGVKAADEFLRIRRGGVGGVGSMGGVGGLGGLGGVGCAPDGNVADRPTPTAITCFNDMLASAVVRRLRLRGIKVPEDVSVIGYDDAPISADPMIQLTTIDQPTKYMANRALEILEAQVEGSGIPTAGQEVREWVNTELIVRATTGPAQH